MKTIKSSASFIDTYVSLAQNLDRREIKDSHERDSLKNSVIELSKNIEGLFNSDPYLHQAITENANIPYYDINESSGGS